MVKKVEKLCKNLQKNLRKKIVKLCGKNGSLKICSKNNTNSQTFPLLFTYLFTANSPLLFINNIHISTEPITTTNIYLINNSNN